MRCSVSLHPASCCPREPLPSPSAPRATANYRATERGSSHEAARARARRRVSHGRLRRAGCAPHARVHRCDVPPRVDTASLDLRAPPTRPLLSRTVFPSSTSTLRASGDCKIIMLLSVALPRGGTGSHSMSRMSRTTVSPRRLQHAARAPSPCLAPCRSGELPLPFDPPMSLDASAATNPTLRALHLRDGFDAVIDGSLV
ncbi:hypothetical protein DFH08DRAFT_440157 [Mycena albidolilacea]|uniref:Uncharacterized protein n=1 Tax=Mycena albidolilacea TaxID=1033008 RepID=A0AAD7EYI3_9AGAR|nr:hypothetical protein DFH08DRAFT_440157 [Mycena albidolilacea]